MIQWYNEMSHHVIESKTSHVYNITVYTCASNFINNYDTNIYEQHHAACSHCSQRFRNISTILIWQLDDIHIEFQPSSRWRWEPGKNRQLCLAASHPNFCHPLEIVGWAFSRLNRKAKNLAISIYILILVHTDSKKRTIKYILLVNL